MSFIYQNWPQILIIYVCFNSQKWVLNFSSFSTNPNYCPYAFIYCSLAREPEKYSALFSSMSAHVFVSTNWNNLRASELGGWAEFELLWVETCGRAVQRKRSKVESLQLYLVLQNYHPMHCNSWLGMDSALPRDHFSVSYLFVLPQKWAK